jgi:hypothetical protein
VKGNLIDSDWGETSSELFVTEVPGSTAAVVAIDLKAVRWVEKIRIFNSETDPWDEYLGDGGGTKVWVSTAADCLAKAATNGTGEPGDNGYTEITAAVIINTDDVAEIEKTLDVEARCILLRDSDTNMVLAIRELEVIGNPAKTRFTCGSHYQWEGPNGGPAPTCRSVDTVFVDLTCDGGDPWYSCDDNFDARGGCEDGGLRLCTFDEFKMYDGDTGNYACSWGRVDGYQGPGGDRCMHHENGGGGCGSTTGYLNISTCSPTQASAHCCDVD